MINFGGKPLDQTIYNIINNTCEALRSHKYMDGPAKEAMQSPAALNSFFALQQKDFDF